MKRTILILTAILTLASCSTEDVCGTITGFGADEYGYYVYVDGSREYVTKTTWEQSYTGDYICLESAW